MLGATSRLCVAQIQIERDGGHENANHFVGLLMYKEIISHVGLLIYIYMNRKQLGKKIPRQTVSYANHDRDSIQHQGD